MRLSIIGHVGSNPTFSASQRPINGGVAQLGERVIRIYEVRGSNPLISTILNKSSKLLSLLQTVDKVRRFHFGLFSLSRKQKSSIALYNK